MKISSFCNLAFWLIVLQLTACQSAQTLSESGFGGTGSPVIAQLDDTSGFGGTGHSSSGFGGTGIIGTVEAFGSIWVNGIEIGYGDQTRIVSNLSSTDTLKLGQQVILETLPLEDKTLTGEIYIHYPIAGQITAISDNTIIVNHQHQIHFTQQGHQDKGLKLTTGNYIAINGFKNSDQSWTATRLNHNPLQKSFYQPEPQLSLSQTVSRWIVEPNLIQHNPWSILRSLKRSATQENIQGSHKMQKSSSKHKFYQFNNPIHRTPKPATDPTLLPHQQRLSALQNQTRQLKQMQHEHNVIHQQQKALQRQKIQAQQKMIQDTKIARQPTRH
ncbi:hypothetical protein CYQ88_04225 [Hydrogenovibrio sp. SC-1]|uniref:DUF5666 domain-containing protein n=1 Tax=Hydrogenovibrio sp. SC-1 TaxID=2065820 RepID=UPI000C7BDDB9|nr:DUF5666 domain-containing protein [Hydrogenovibrio sp. SC-1]PLA74803.1 hypothetical protein CYQ88_04225 [Hydrogenovibrio sp. SC-1]